MRIKHLLLASAAAILTACATATPYQSANLPNGKTGYGFSQTQVQDNRFTVSFAGNSLTDRETVETYLLYRSAELAVENGYNYFRVAEKDTEEKKRVVGSPSYGAYGYGFANPYYRGFACNYDFYSPRYGWRSRWSPYGRYPVRRSAFHSRWGDPFYDPFYDDFNYREITRYKASADVIFTQNSGGDETFNAKEVLKNIGPKVIFPEDLES